MPTFNNSFRIAFFSALCVMLTSISVLLWVNKWSENKKSVYPEGTLLILMISTEDKSISSNNIVNEGLASLTLNF